MSLTSNIQDVEFSSAFDIDKIIGTFEGSFSAPSGAAPERTTQSITTSIPESTLFQGIFSVDGGSDWHDFGADILSGSLLNVTVSGRSNSDTFSVVADNFTAGGGATTYTVLYKVALIAKPNQGTITPQPVGADIIFDSRLNYQKIVSDVMRSISIPNASEGIEVFAHSLGYIPKVRSFIEIDSAYGADAPAGLYESVHFARLAFGAGATAPNPNFQTTSGIYLDDINASIVLKNNTGRGNFSGTLFMRIYYDA